MSLCLNMIVKNEQAVIQRCLESVLSVIDYWVILDTGSTDGTQDLIKALLKDIPGELYERPWKNFGESRTEALQLAQGKSDYILFMDADDTLEFEGEKRFPPLSTDLYLMWRGTKEFSYLKPQIVRSSKQWKWVGVTHEYLHCSEAYSSETLKHVRYCSGPGGARSKGIGKFLENITLLTDALKQDPTNARYVFYLAESYRDAGETGKAIERYQERVLLGGWEEEIFWSKLQIATLFEKLSLPQGIVHEAFLDAHLFRPHRPEPIYHLARSYNQQGDYPKAYHYLKTYLLTQDRLKRDVLFNAEWIRNYGLLFELSISSYYVGSYQESLDLCDTLLSMHDLPEHLRKQTAINKTYPLAKLNASSLAKKGKYIQMHSNIGAFDKESLQNS